MYDNKINPQFYLQIFPIIHTPTVVQENTLDAIRHKAVITFTSFKAAFRAGKWVNEAGTGPTTRVGTHLIVTVFRARCSYKRRRHL